jgi:hypothetical protein
LQPAKLSCCLSLWCNFLQNMEKYRNLIEKWQQNDNASRKMQFLQPAKLSFCLSFFFVIWWKICIFPECVARVPVSLWGSGGWGCVRWTLRSRSQPSATVRVRTVWPCLW